MNSVTSLTAKQFRKAARVQERIEALQDKLQALLGATPAPAAIKTGRRKRRKLSRRGLANIRAGVKKRMAATQPGGAAEAPAATPKKRKVSAAGRARLSALARARWRKAKAEGRSRL